VPTGLCLGKATTNDKGSLPKTFLNLNIPEQKDQRRQALRRDSVVQKTPEVVEMRGCGVEIDRSWWCENRRGGANA
jgi:hypothetical protein